MPLPDKVTPPEPRMVRGLVFFGSTSEEAEHAAKGYLGRAEPAN